LVNLILSRQCSLRAPAITGASPVYRENVGYPRKQKDQMVIERSSTEMPFDESFILDMASQETTQAPQVGTLDPISIESPGGFPGNPVELDHQPGLNYQLANFVEQSVEFLDGPRGSCLLKATSEVTELGGNHGHFGFRVNEWPMKTRS
jgi:hypothetical protein